MSNDAGSMWDGASAGESFPASQAFEDHEQHYHHSQLDDSGTYLNLPRFDSIYQPSMHFDQTYNSPVYQLPPLDNLRGPYTGYTSNDLYDVSTDDTDLPTQSTSDAQWPTPQEESSEICFGMIRGVRVRFMDDEKYLYVTSVLMTEPFRLICSLEFTKDRCKLKPQGDTSKAVATLSTKYFTRLDKLQRDFELRLEGIFLQQQVDAMDKSLVTSVDINVYGDRSRGDDIADVFAEAGYFLQDPTWKPDEIDYINPQVLELPHFEDIILIANEQSSGMLASSNLSRQTAKFVKPYGIDYDGILDDFARQDYLAQAVVDNRIRTNLLPYQKMGVDFILKRESTLATPEHTLWNLERNDDEEIFYRHSITGATSEVPRQMLGGILADDMGLGKSLTMLSAIMASLSDAESYAYSKTISSSEDDQSVIAAKSTLLIVPSALLIDNWIAEIEKHVHPGNVSYYKYHGHRRNIQRSELIQNDIVLTTYGTVAVERNRLQKLLFGIDWYRVVLDEAHIIRNSSTHNFEAVYQLRSLIRWCMSGTPIQNKIEDLATQIRFLRLQHLEDPIQFRKHISHKIQLRKENTMSDFQNLRALLKSVCLRRNKTVLPMSSHKEETCEVSFNSQERAEYERLAALLLQAHDMMVSGRAAQHNHSTVLRIILRLRLLCNNGPVRRSSGAPFMLHDSDDVFALLQQEGSATCHFCRRDIVSVTTAEDPETEDPESARITPCSHLVCFECLDLYKLGWEMDLCPICHQEHEQLSAPQDQDVDSSLDETATATPPALSIDYPSKLMKLCENVKVEIDNHKSIIFSFWIKTLDIVCNIFDEQNIPYLRLDGNVPYAKRKDIISQFQQSKEGMILLMTLGIGAVGLNNLSVASHIHILEPQWNPQVEAQAIGRVIRLGQERPVRIVRYLVKGTVERGIRDRQIQKLRLSRAGVHDGEDVNSYPGAVLLKDLIHPNDDNTSHQLWTLE